MGRIEKQKRKLIEEANKRLLGLITEDAEDKIAILFDGTSSAGKSYTAKQLNAVPFYKATDTNQWVVIDSDDFGANDTQGIENRIKYDHAGDGPNKNAGEEFHKEMAQVRKGQFFDDGKTKSGDRGMTTIGFPKHPHNKDIIDGTDWRNWYMAQEYKHGGWKKVIFDDIGNDILKYIPNIKSKLLIHSPIEVMLGNIKSRNDEAVKQNDESLSRNPKVVLGQYLEKYEATTSKPDLTVGDPTTDITKKGLKTALMDAMTDNYPDYDEEYIDGFIDDLGVKDDNATHWIKVKDNYLSDDQVLINVGDDQQTYITDIKEKYFTNEK